MEEKKVRKKYCSWKVILAVMLVLVIASAVGIYAFVHTEYEYIEIVKNYESQSTNNGNYLAYLDGVLEYSKDGVAFLTKEGEEIWNQPGQMSNPIAKICKETAAVADKGGTSIYVFNKNGLKGEIQTTRPIERVSVSAQGIVSAILQDDESPRVMCYDAKGNVLVEHKASLKNTGYPVDVALSQDGEVLMVSYLCTKGSSVVTKATFYYFGEDAKNKKDHVVLQKDYKDAVAPTAVFLNQRTSLLVTDHSLVFYEGLKKPEEAVMVKMDKEIESISYNEKYVALILKNSGKTGYELRLYQTNGKEKMNVQLDGEYSNIKVMEGQVLLNDGSKCAIYNTSGVCKFKGRLEMNVMDIHPVSGINKYMVISANGFQEIQLAK